MATGQVQPFRFGNRFQNKLAKYENIYGAGNYNQRDRSQGFNRRFLRRADEYRAKNPMAPSTGGGLQAPPVAEVPQVTNDEAIKGLFPGAMAFEPKMYEGSPLYQWQKNEGIKSLDTSLAARGLTNSGAELELKQKLLSQLGAQESERARGVAQQEADRFERMQGRESDRLERDSNEQFNRLYNMLNLLLQQNPYQSGVDANRSLANLILEDSRRRGAQQGGLYARAGGGGGGGFRPDLTQFGPDYSLANAAGAQAGAQTSSMLSNLINQIAANYMKG